MTDQRLEELIGNLLRAGVILAAVVVLAGGLWYLADNRGPVPSYGHFKPNVQGFQAVATLPKPEALILIGLVLLILTPIARVVFAMVGFALEHDRTYVIITIVVLVVLLYSIATALV